MNQQRTYNFKSGPTAARRHSAFTLVEVMISVALVLLLIYGISKVFKLSTDTIGAQQALATITRDHRAFQETLGQDFKNAVSDSPVFIISSRIGYMGAGGGMKSGFKNAEEERNSPSPNPTKLYVNGQQMPDVPQYSMSDRVPRLDRLSFFTRGLFRRQTANDNDSFSSTTANEAYVWYGHTALPTNTSFVAPFDQYASQRVLGRAAYLFRDRTTVPAGEKRMNFSNDPLAPLDYASGNYDMQAGGDLAPISMDFWRQNADTAFYNDGANGYATWFAPLEDFNGKSFRVWCDPRTPRPITSKTLARSVPYFVGNCTQFVVEYAGDFIAQKDDGTYLKAPGDTSGVGTMIDPNSGAIVKGQTDGIIDFMVEPVTGAHKIRWYGLYRDIDGSGTIDARYDVVPLADLLQLNDTTKFGCGIKAGPKGPPRAPWEAVLPTINPINNAFAYVCAWHNDSPLLIRVSMKIDDPTNRLQDGQWYEYVFAR